MRLAEFNKNIQNNKLKHKIHLEYYLNNITIEENVDRHLQALLIVHFCTILNAHVKRDNPEITLYMIHVHH